MKERPVSRRDFLSTASAGSLAAAAAQPPPAAPGKAQAGAPALLGGQPIRSRPFPPWPIWKEADEKAILPVLQRGVWSRDKRVTEAEQRFARMMGAKHCLATCNGTNAIYTAFRALDLGPGDEVITTPYTFVASIQPLLLSGALPVFADIDPVTWQIDPDRIEAKITRNTVALFPVHIIGGVCDMDRINAIARKHNLKVVEDACEAHFGEWKNRKVGTLGDLGCFSFQTGKALTCGEGGAILGESDALMDRCYSFHNLGRPHGSVVSKNKSGHPIVGSKCRMAEYQASILMTQMEVAVAQAQTRSENAAYLLKKLAAVPGIVPRTDYAQVTHTAFYYFGIRYQKDKFDGLHRDRFISALGAEGIPANKGLGVIEGLPMNKEEALFAAFQSKLYQRVYAREKLAAYPAENDCPLCDSLVEETVGFHQRMFLGTKEDMDDICRAVQKVYDNRKKLV